MNINRRSFLGGALALTAVAAVPAGIIVANLPVLYGDMVHDDAPALNAMFSGNPFRTADGFMGIAKRGILCNSRHLLKSEIRVTVDNVLVSGAHFTIDHPGAALVLENCAGGIIKNSYFEFVDDARRPHFPFDTHLVQIESQINARSNSNG